MPDQLFCHVRKRWMKALPEELVRQTLIEKMVNHFNYPLSGLALEQDLRHCPHLSHLTTPLPKRRADVICFAKGIHPSYSMYPLLLIECKAVKLTNKVIRQTIGYNFYLQASFIAIANQDEIRLGWFNHKQQQFSFIPHLLPYTELVSKSIQLYTHHHLES